MTLNSHFMIVHEWSLWKNTSVYKQQVSANTGSVNYTIRIKCVNEVSWPLNSWGMCGRIAKVDCGSRLLCCALVNIVGGNACLSERCTCGNKLFEYFLISLFNVKHFLLTEHTLAVSVYVSNRLRMGARLNSRHCERIGQVTTRQPSLLVDKWCHVLFAAVNVELCTCCATIWRYCRTLHQ